MSGPKFANFSRVSGSVAATIERIADGVCSPWHCAPTHLGRLARSTDPYDGGFALDGELVECSSQDIRRVAEDERPFALLYVAYGPRANFGVHFTDITQDGHTVTVELDRTMVYHHDDDFPERGRWFEGFLISLVIAVGAAVCAAGDTVVVDDKNMSLAEITELMKRPRYFALDPDTVLERLRRGDLLSLPGPVLHAFAAGLLDVAESKLLAKQAKAAKGLAYKQAPGYHVFSNIVIS